MSASENATSRLMVRVPAELHERLRARAEANERSVNGEIVYALKRYVTALDATQVISEDEVILRAAIERAERGESLPLPPGAMAILRREIRRGTPADEALMRAGLGGGGA